MRNIFFLLALTGCGEGVVVEVVHVDADVDADTGEGEGEGDVEGEGEGEGEGDAEGGAEVAPAQGEGEGEGEGEGDVIVDDGICTEDDLPIENAGVVEPDGLGGCGAGMAPVAGTFCMDRWEAFLERADGTGFSPFQNPGSDDVIARSAPGAVPQGYINGLQAAGACEAAGKRLCSDDEWLRACRGALSTTYPYGNVRQPRVCNDARAVHPAVEYFGTGDSWIWSELGHPCINQQHDTVDTTGAHAGCVDDAGTHFDLMGNLHEWTSDPNGTFRGGFYVDTRLNGEGCLYRTTAHDRSHWDYSTGFRCCSDL